MESNKNAFGDKKSFNTKFYQTNIMESKPAKELIVDILKEKSSIKQEVYKHNQKVFKIFKKEFAALAAHLSKQLSGYKDVKIEYKDKGPYEAEIRFVGNKSVENVSTIKNPDAINLLKQLCQKHSGKEFLFY